MSDKMVFLMNVRREADFVRGSSGKRVCSNLDESCQGREGIKPKGSGLRYGSHDIPSPQHDQVLDQGPAKV